jgi:tetratricopeptide (TPR) repeat protein
MLTGTVALAAAAQSGSNGSNWGLIAAIITAFVAVAALVLRELQRRRSDLDQKVADAVSASIGRTLLEFREFEASIRASLETTVRTAADIEEQLRERLSVSEAHSGRLADLLARAADVVPRLETSRSAIPSMLVAKALRSDPQEGLDALSALLTADRATVDDLESGGDIAIQRFGANALALELYERATQINPDLASAMASVVLLQTRSGQLSIDEGRARMSELARSNPNNRNALSEALNLYSGSEDYEGMLQLVDELLETNERNALLLRNRAVALMRLGRIDECEQAFIRSYEIARERGDDDELSNTARPYARFLMEASRYDDARDVLEGALAGDPESTQLLTILGDLLSKDDDPDRALRCYQAALDASTNPVEHSAAERRLRRLVAREELVKNGLLSKSDSPGPKASEEQAPSLAT